MKLYVNCKGPKVGTGKIEFENMLELITLEDALKHYKEYIFNNNTFNTLDLKNRLKIIDNMINNLRVDHAEKSTKKFESNLGIGLSEFLRSSRLEKNISSKGMAQKLSVKPCYYHDIEKELIQPSADLLIKVFNILNLTYNITIKLHSHIPAIEYYYKNSKITEICFKLKEDYINDCEIIKNNIPAEKFQEV
jgi:transcriptional regulator with XRE-family HTH domain